MDIPDTLAERLAIYRRTGRVYREADELFTKTSWLAVMDGQGLVTAEHDPIADALSAEDARAALARIGTVIAAAKDRMPRHEAFIAQHCRATR